jgi:hypothetical protein
MLDILSQN